MEKEGGGEEGVWERENECEWERVCVCVCVRERERERKRVCVHGTYVNGGVLMGVRVWEKIMGRGKENNSSESHFHEQL